MGKRTHPERLSEVFKELVTLIKSDGNFQNRDMIVNVSKSDEMNRLLDSAEYCVKAISQIIDFDHRLTDDAQRKMFRRKLDRIERVVQRGSLAVSGKRFLSDFFGELMDENIRDLHEIFADRGIYELIDEDEIEQLSKAVKKLKKLLLNSNLDQHLKLTIISILLRLEEIFQTYGYLGEQELKQIIERWAGVLIIHNDLLAKEGHAEVREGIGKILIPLMGKVRQGAEIIQVGQAYSGIAKFLGVELDT